MKFVPGKSSLLRLLPFCVLLNLGMMPEVLQPKPVLGAEKIVLAAGLLERDIPLHSLKTFAQTGQMSEDLAFYAQFVDQQTLNQLRSLLQRRFRVNVVTVSRLMYSPLGTDALKQLGSLIRADARLNGFHALRAASLIAASNPDGFTLLDLLQAFPSDHIDINLEQLLSLQRLFTAITHYTDTTVQAIAAQDQQETTQTPTDFSRLPDPLKPGPFTFNQTTFTLQRLTQPLMQKATQRKRKIPHQKRLMRLTGVSFALCQQYKAIGMMHNKITHTTPKHLTHPRSMMSPDNN
jgi:hypothetical protein